MTSRNLLRGLLVCGVSLGGLAGAAQAQTATDIVAPNSVSGSAGDDAIVVTGSRIKRDPTKSALPLEIITSVDIERNGIANPEALNMFLTANGSGPDNLASNSDVVTGAQRGTNGLSAANLRGQGSASTLVLLNGRRVAAHGLSGGAVDVNQIPFAAIERVEILKDGASAIYGTDAIGGVINYITKKDFHGVSVSGSTDFTQHGGGNIYRLSGVAGYGDLDSDGINIMGAVSYSWNEILRGSQRDFVNGNQPLRGLSIDTRGTPIATIFNTGSSALNPINPATGTHTATLTNGLTLGTPNSVGGGINILDLPGGAGCQTMDGGMAYDELLWATPSAQYACAWDTGRAAVIQQPIETLTYYGRATVRLGGDHQLSAEVTGSSAHSAKSFSNAQLSGNTTSLPIGYPYNAATAVQYDAVFNALLNAFPSAAAALNANYKRPIGFRWRCAACGPREYRTNTRTLRATVALEGPLPLEGWDYKVAASHAESESSSILGTGYYYRGTTQNSAGTWINDPMAPIAPGATQPGLVGLMNSGIINPFSAEQSPAAMAGLQAISAYGATLYGGRYAVKEVDASFSGPLFDLPGGTVQMAIGFDWRRESYSFNGSSAGDANQPAIFLAAFDNVNALTPKHRTIKAGYAEINLPIFDMLEVTGAVRVDDYGDFGTTTNPKVSAKFQPAPWVMMRGSYSTGFRVPTFNQLYNGITESPYSGRDLVDPFRCASGLVSTTDPNCLLIQPNIRTHGNLDLGAETAKLYSLGVVLRPSARVSLSVDWWRIDVDKAVELLTERQIIDNYSLFPTWFIRDPLTTNITAIDRQWINAGARSTEGIEISFRGAIDGLGGQLTLGADGSYLLRKREQLTPIAPWGPSLVGVFSFTGDLGLRWKHNAWLSYSNKDWAITFTQIFRSGYKNQALPGIANGTVTRSDFNVRVKPYAIYNLSASYLGLGPAYRLTVGIKNLFDTDPPFAITYDSNSGAGSSWEPRVADPRGRSFTVAVEVRF